MIPERNTRVAEKEEVTCDVVDVLAFCDGFGRSPSSLRVDVPPIGPAGGHGRIAGGERFEDVIT